MHIKYHKKTYEKKGKRENIWTTLRTPNATFNLLSFSHEMTNFRSRVYNKCPLHHHVLGVQSLTSWNKEQKRKKNAVVVAGEIMELAFRSVTLADINKPWEEVRLYESGLPGISGLCVKLRLKRCKLFSTFFPLFIQRRLFFV